MLNLFEAIFLETRKEKTKDWEKDKMLNLKRIQEIEREKQKIEKYLLNETAIPSIAKRFEENRSLLDQEEKILTEQVESEKSYEQEKKIILTKTKELIKSPLSFRELGDVELRKLLISVRFGDSLMYSKSGGLQTTENTSLYSVLKDLKQSFPKSCLRGDSNP